jgi:hypothetical protein
MNGITFKIETLILVVRFEGVGGGHVVDKTLKCIKGGTVLALAHEHNKIDSTS